MAKSLPVSVRLKRLRRAALPGDTAALARFLIGKYLVHDAPAGRMAGRIVETEAYAPGDSSAHSFRGPTPRNRSLFLERGHAYVYFIYGNWYAVNVSGEKKGVGAGVLLRACEPVEGLLLMRRNYRGAAADLGRGPGRLAAAMDIDRRLDGVDLCGPGPLWLGSGGAPARGIGASSRIGLSRETHRLMRFYEKGSLFLSGPKRLNV